MHLSCGNRSHTLPRSNIVAMSIKMKYVLLLILQEKGIQDMSLKNLLGRKQGMKDEALQ